MSRSHHRGVTKKSVNMAREFIKGKAIQGRSRELFGRTLGVSPAALPGRGRELFERTLGVSPAALPGRGREVFGRT